MQTYIIITVMYTTKANAITRAAKQKEVSYQLAQHLKLLFVSHLDTDDTGSRQRPKLKCLQIK